MSKFKLVLVLVLAFLIAPNLWAQYEGNISGQVKDESGAVVPGADVVITNEATGVARTVVSDDSGYYLATNVPVGEYSVSVEMPGFTKSLVHGVKVDIKSNRKIDLILKVGGAANEITVESASVAQVELSSGEVSNLIEAKQVAELPLNNRSFVQLSLLVPGASVQQNANVGLTGLFAGVDISFSGSPSNANMWLVDGTNNVDVGSGRTILTYPSVDSIAEFKISRNLYGADSAASSGAQINVVTKSGTNEFHGTLYEFHRNKVLNAADFDLNRNGADKQSLVYNNFGYTVGGPIVKDKAFFFWSQEWRRERRGVPRARLVPTLLERAGDFSGPNSRGYPDPIDPLTGALFPDNRIPADRLSPAGQALYGLFPNPTIGLDDPRFTGSNWVAAPSSPIDTRQEQIRGDYVINQVHSILGRLTLDTWKNASPSYIEGGLWGDDPFPQVDSAWDQPGFSLTTEWTATFGPNVVNQVNFSFSGNEIKIARGAGEQLNAAVTSAIPEVFPGPEDRGHPVFWGSPVGESLWHQAPWQNNQDLYVWKDDLSLVKGSHSMKLGVLVSRNAKNEDVSNNSQAYSPEFWSDGGRSLPAAWAGGSNVVDTTTNGVADLLLRGTFWGAGNEHDRNARATTRWRDYEFFYADTWRMTPRFTLNYGVRWSYLPNPFSDRDEIANFSLALYDPAEGATPNNGVILPGNTRGLDVDSRALVKNHKADIAPRIGFAWDPSGSGRWSIRGGGGVFYNREAITDVLRLHTNPPFVTSIAWSARPLDSLPTDITFSGGEGVAANAKDLEAKTPGSYQWNLTIERELWKDTKVELAYVANRGHNIPTQLSLNAVPVEDRFAYTIQNVVNADPDGANANYRPLFPLVGGSGDILYTSRSADSWYHSFQAYLVKRFSNRLSYQVSYTWSKLLSTSYGLGELSGSNISDASNIGYDKSLSSTDRTHLFNANLIWRTPGLESMGAWARGFLGDWETSVIFTANSGVPQNITCCTNFTGTRENRPDLIGNPEGNHNVNRFFNTSAFAPPSRAGALGDSSRGQYRGPGINNWDISAVKNFVGLPWFTKENATLQFRAEFFNAFNHTQFQFIDNGFSPVDITFDDNGNLTGYNQSNNNFGRVTGFRQGREIQLALKIIW